MVVGKTKQGKELVLKPDGTGLFFIEMQGGGKKPKELSGLFTGYTAAKEAANAYLVKKDYVYRRNKQREAEEGNDAKNVTGTGKR